jgi:polar amino acid transport system substrate-binding protein
VKSTSPIKSIEKAEDIAGLRIIVGSGTNQEAILLAWNAENLKKGLKPLPRSTPKTMRRKPWRCSRARGCLLWPERDWRVESGANRKTKLVGSVDGGWPKAAHIAVTLKKAAVWLSRCRPRLTA